MSAKTASESEKIVCTNRKARHDYYIQDTIETGVVLVGTEVKSLREGRAHLKDSYALVKNGEVFLFNCHISPYTHGNLQNHEPLRTRKLLLHRAQIRKLVGLTTQKGFTLVPLKIYFTRSKVKLALGIAKGKKLHDKRHALREKEAQRDMERALKEVAGKFH